MATYYPRPGKMPNDAKVLSIKFWIMMVYSMKNTYQVFKNNLELNIRVKSEKCLFIFLNVSSFAY